MSSQSYFDFNSAVRIPNSAIGMSILPEKSVKGNVSDLKTFKTLEILTTHF